MGILAFVSCGKKSVSTFPGEPNREEILAKAWKSYDSGNFAEAEFWFDSLLVLELKDREALVGKGYTLFSKENTDDEGAISYFSLVTALDGIGLFNKVFKEQAEIVVRPSLPYGTDWAIRVKNKNVLWVDKVVKLPAVVLSPKYFDDTLIYFEGEIPDTIVVVDYTVYTPQPGTDDIFLWSWAGIGLVYLYRENNSAAAQYLYSLVRRTKNFYFPHYPYLTQGNIIGSAAYAFYREGMYGNCVDLLKIAGWKDVPDDPFSSRGILSIILKIEELINE